MSRIFDKFVVGAVLPALLLSQSSLAFARPLPAPVVLAQATPEELELLKKKVPVPVQPEAPKPVPVAPKPAPEAPKPVPVVPRPARVDVAPKPAPVAPKPVPVEIAPKPVPVVPKPAPIEVAPKPVPVVPKPAPVDVAPKPVPVVPKPVPVDVVPKPVPVVPKPAPVEVAPVAPKAPPVPVEPQVVVPAKKPPPVETFTPPAKTLPVAPVTPAAPGTTPVTPPTPPVVKPVPPVAPVTPAAPGTTPVTPPTPPVVKPVPPVVPVPPTAPGTAPVTPPTGAGATPATPPLTAPISTATPPGAPVPLTAPAPNKRKITPLEAATLGAAAGLVGGYLLGTGVQQHIDDVRALRQETEVEGATIYREPGRTIIREEHRIFIRHDENERFRELGGNIQTERRGRNFLTTYDRPDGTQIVTLTDESGQMLRRSRRYPDGREFVIIDNTYRPARRSYDEEIITLAPEPIRIEPHRYVVDADAADDGVLYEALSAPPVARVPRRYTLDEVRSSPDLRNRMRSIDVNTVTFDTGSFTVTPDQAARLDNIARALLRALKTRPNEVFLVEGYTDAVGSDVDNLSLSDRRAQSVANILTSTYNVPPENMTTQGYGSQYLKVNTLEAERANRRVTLRRITPLITGQARPGARAAVPEEAPAQ